MRIKVFGIARDLIGGPELKLGEMPEIKKVSDLKHWLITAHPELSGLQSFAIAVDSEYAGDEDILQPDSEIAIIPPVSGG